MSRERRNSSQDSLLSNEPIPASFLTVMTLYSHSDISQLIEFFSCLLSHVKLYPQTFKNSKCAPPTCLFSLPRFLPLRISSPTP